MPHSVDIGLCLHLGGQLAFMVRQKDPKNHNDMCEHIVFASTGQEAVAYLRESMWWRKGEIMTGTTRVPEYDMWWSTGVPDEVLREEGWWIDFFDPVCDQCALFEWSSLPMSTVGKDQLCVDCREKNNNE